MGVVATCVMSSSSIKISKKKNVAKGGKHHKINYRDMFEEYNKRLV